MGWTFLDWALPLLPAEGMTLIEDTARAAIAEVRRLWADLRQRRSPPESEGHALSWMGTQEHLVLAARSLQRRVLAPFAERGIEVKEPAAPAIISF